MKSIRNIVIDLGGVMIDLDRDRCVRAFEALGVQDAGEMLGLYRQGEPFLSLETGRITSAQFYDEIRSISGRRIDDRLIEAAFNDFLVSLPVERLAAVRALRGRGYRTFMLSNTNGIMYDGWIKGAFMQEGLHAGDYFDGIITSFAEGACKPDDAIFLTLLNRFGLDPEETVLLDDSQANCEAARAVGMKAIRIYGDTSLLKLTEDGTF